MRASASPPSRPSTAPRCRAKNIGQITVSWDDVERNNGASVFEYRLEWAHVPSPEPCSPISTRQHTRESEDHFEFNLLYAGPQLSHDLFHVPPACSFRFRVCAINAAGMSEWSPLGKYVTAPASPAAPDRLGYVLSPLSPSCGGACCSAKTAPSSSDPITVHEALFKWAKPLSNGSPITAYRIELTRLSQDTEQHTSTKSRSATNIGDQVETFEISAADADSIHEQNSSDRHFLCHFLDHLSALTIYKLVGLPFNKLFQYSDRSVR
ncbi:Fibronectin type III domain-containing protein 3B [Cichlidogyrus casuarinus]|uniref:Fibronectin type III domain-containing protein 3B n=1 Tax=Cichlidogyrus casuarinus TaxID=1844966 RepID=A0ABD2QI98_9PLAT